MIMATQKLEELTIEQLREKEKKVIRELIFLAIIWLTGLVIFIITKTSLKVTIAIMVVISIGLWPFVESIIKVKKELKKRENMV
jgi:uncharacterized membrane protein YccF (DUF307 family)